jgi:hypothetical protein
MVISTQARKMVDYFRTHASLPGGIETDVDVQYDLRELHRDAVDLTSGRDSNQPLFGWSDQVAEDSPRAVQEETYVTGTSADGAYSHLEHNVEQGFSNGDEVLYFEDRAVMMKYADNPGGPERIFVMEQLYDGENVVGGSEQFFAGSEMLGQFS